MSVSNLPAAARAAAEFWCADEQSGSPDLAETFVVIFFLEGSDAAPPSGSPGDWILLSSGGDPAGLTGGAPPFPTLPETVAPTHGAEYEFAGTIAASPTQTCYVYSTVPGRGIHETVTGQYDYVAASTGSWDVNAAPASYPGPRQIYDDWVALLEWGAPQPYDYEMEEQDHMVEQANRRPGISAGGPTETVERGS